MNNKEDSKESLINDLQKKHKSYESKRLLHQKNDDYTNGVFRHII